MPKAAAPTAAPAVAVEDVVLAAALEAVGSNGAVARDFLVLPYGTYRGRDGQGPYVLEDRTHAEAVIAATEALWGPTRMMIDYDHQSARVRGGNGGQALSAGWVERIYATDEGIRASVEWTPRAEAALADREYRYISPDFRVDPASRRATRLFCASLTNQPNFDLPALAHVGAGANPGEEPTMKTIALSTTALVAALALNEADLSEASVLAAIGQLKTARDADAAVLASVRTDLSLAADADGEAVLAAVGAARNAGEPDPARFVPKAALDAANARLVQIEEERVLASVDAAVADGKLAPAQRDWAISLGKKDQAALAGFLASVVPFGGDKATVQGDPKPEKGKVTAEEVAIASMLGVSEADFLKTRNEEAV